MPTIHTLLHERLEESVQEDSFPDAERALDEIIENHRAAGRTVREGLHDGRPAWHVVTETGAAYAVFWISA